MHGFYVALCWRDCKEDWIRYSLLMLLLLYLEDGCEMLEECYGADYS